MYTFPHLTCQCFSFLSTIAQAGASGHWLLALQQRCVPSPLLHCTCWVVRSLLVWSLQPACLLCFIHAYMYIHGYLAVRAIARRQGLSWKYMYIMFVWLLNHMWDFLYWYHVGLFMIFLSINGMDWDGPYTDRWYYMWMPWLIYYHAYRFSAPVDRNLQWV